MSECENCEYRACRQENGDLGPCQEPILSKEIDMLKKDLKVSVLITIGVILAMLYGTGVINGL